MMLEVTVKTLDSQNHNFCVQDEITVKEFKEEISSTLNIPADKQRLIFCGKVLKDDKKLNEYGVDGKVVHVVQSLPPQSASSSSASNSSSSTATNTSRTGGPRDAAGFLLGAFTIPQDLIDPTQVQNIVQEVVSGMGEIGRNATVMSRTSDDGSSVDVHINLGQLPMQSEAQLRMNRVQTMLLRANRLLGFLEDGTNGQNNGSSADSSSQTEEAEDLRVSSMDIDLSSLNSVDNGVSSSTVDSTTSTEAPRANNIEVIAIHGDASPPASNTSERRSSFPERIRFEGLANAAQAAISAALATAAAAARVATASVSGTPTTTSGTGNNSNSTDSEPMDLSAAADSLRLISDHFLQRSGNIPSDESNTMDAEALPIRVDIETSTQNSTSDSRADAETASSSNEPRLPTTEGEARSDALPPRREATQPSVQTLANLLDEVIRLNTRLEPCLERCRDLIRRDPPLFGRQLSDAHRLFSRISQLLHFMSHAYHSLSDLHINFSQVPPRSPRVRIISSAHGSSIIHAGIPLQAQISVTSGVLTPQSSSTTTTANTTTNAETNTANTVPQSASRSTNTETPTSTGTNAASSALPSVASILRNQNPLFFMEVSPAAVSFTSAEVGRFPAPRMQIPTTDRADRDQRSMQTETTTTTATTTDNSTSTNQNATRPEPPPPSSRPAASVNLTAAGQAHPLINLPFRNMIPVPLTSIGSVQAFDAGLPCHSVWALEPSRRRHNAGGSRTPAGIQIGLTPNVPGRQEEQLTQVISNIMMSLLNHPNVPPSGAPAAGTFTISSASTPTEAANRATRLLFDSESTPRRAGRPEAGESNGSYSSQQFTYLNEADFRHLMVDFFLACGGLQLNTLSEILSSYCAVALERDRLGRFGNLLWFIASKLSLNDIWEIYKGNLRPIIRMEFPLKMYLLDVFFDGGARTPDAEAIDLLMDEFISDFAPALEYFASKVPGLPGSDFKKSISEFLKKAGTDILKTILAVPGHQSKEGYSTYGRRAFREFLSLLENTLLGGRETFCRVLVSSVQGLQLPATLKRAMLALISRIVLCTPLEEGTAPDPGEASGSRAPSSEAPDHKEKKAPSVPTRSREPADGQENSAAPFFTGFARLAERTSALLRSSARPEDDNIAEVVIGSQGWHNTLPREWVPIITRDVQRQRRQAPQAPFSNAYMSGMPSKRRKIMTTGSTPLLGTSQGTLSELLLQAVQSTGARPLTSTEELRRETSRDTALQSSFEEHLKGAIQERLHRDLDYCSERFPNAEKYFIDRM